MKNRRRPRAGSQRHPTAKNAKSKENEENTWNVFAVQTVDQLVHSCHSFPATIVPAYEPILKKALQVINRQQELQEQLQNRVGEECECVAASRFPVVEGASDLERTACSLVRKADLLKGYSATTADCLFYIAINFTRPGEEYEESIETNSQQLIKALIDAVIRGTPTDTLSRFLQLCIHLRDTTGQYPIRYLVTESCLKLLENTSVSSRVTSWLLRFILGPADYILYHLESRLALLAKAQMLRSDPRIFDDMETKALVERLSRLLKLQPQGSVAEQIRYRAYSYLERLIHDPLWWSKADNVLKEMPLAQWKLCLEKDPLLWLFMDQHPDAFAHFWISMSLLKFEYSPLEHNLETLFRHLNNESKGIPELLSIILEEELERDWKKDHDSCLATMLSLEASNQWTTLRQLRQGIVASASRVVENQMISREDDTNTSTATRTAFLQDLYLLVQRLSSVVAMAPLTLLFRMMYILTLCVHVTDSLLETLLEGDDVENLRLVSKIQALCLDAWHTCLVRRYEPRQQQQQQQQQQATHQGTTTSYIEQSPNHYQQKALMDIRRSLVLAIVFVAPILPLFAYNASLTDTDGKMSSASNVFLSEAFQALIPTLEMALDWELMALATTETCHEPKAKDNQDGEKKNSLLTPWLASLLIRQWTNESGLWDETELQACGKQFQTLVGQLEHHSSFSTSSLWQYLDLPQ